MRKFLALICLFILSCSKQYTIEVMGQSNEVKLCVIGDTGTGNETQLKVAKLLEQEKCDSIHFLGDIIYPDGINSETDPELQKKFLDYYFPLSEKDSLPYLYLIMGNHDYHRKIQPWLDKALKTQRIVFPNPYYIVKDRGLCFAYIDTNLFKLPHHWVAGMTEIHWLSQLEEEFSQCKIKIALTHHPYLSHGTHHGPATGLTKWILEYYVIGKFDYLLSGHDHILSDEGIKDKTQMLISGAGGKPDEKQSPGFLVLKVNMNNYTSSFEWRKITK